MDRKRGKRDIGAENQRHKPGVPHRLKCVRKGNGDKLEMSTRFSHGATSAKTDAVPSMESCRRAEGKRVQTFIIKRNNERRKQKVLELGRMWAGWTLQIQRNGEWKRQWSL